MESHLAGKRWSWLSNSLPPVKDRQVLSEVTDIR